MLTLRNWLPVMGIGIVSSLAGCGDSDDAPPPGVSATAGRSANSGAGGGTSGKGGRSGAGGKGGSEAGAADDGGEANAGGADAQGVGGEGGDEQAGQGGNAARAGSGGIPGLGGGGMASFDCPEPGEELPDDFESLCDPAARFDTPEPVSIPASGLDVLLSVTPDELSIVWIADEGFALSNYVADRESVDAEFSTPQRLEDEPLASARKLALSPDGLRLVAAVDDSFLVAVRASRGEAFGEAEPGEFSVLDSDALDRGVRLADPVIAPDDRTLYYSLEGAGTSTLYVSVRGDDEPWPLGAPIDDCELASHPLGTRQPTGVSADGLTLFYFDSARGLSRAAFRATPSAPFALFVDLPGDGVQPNAACDRVYYSVATEPPFGVVVAERN